jgi:hypothetical protein
VQVDVFRATETRTRSWTAEETIDLNGVQVHPIRVREEFEQLGRGSQAGREMTMTAQGSRSGNYYVTLDGRVDGATLRQRIVSSRRRTERTSPLAAYAFITRPAVEHMHA